MPISQSKQVFNLIKSLTPAEKRHFRLYARRIQDSDQLMFLQLFDLLDKAKDFEEQEVINKLGKISKGQFSNLKRHLYTQVIASLRVARKEKQSNFKVREFIDYAYILYGKGLYLQALKILNKARTLADKHHLIYMQLAIIEFEKKIESRHITRSGSNRAQALIEESNLIQQDADHLVRLSNLRISMHAKYLHHGHVKNQTEAANIREHYHQQIAPIDISRLGLVERIYYVQSRVWYNYILLDFQSCLKYAKQWVDLLDDNTNMRDRDVDLYMRGVHYVLTTAMHTQDHTAHQEYLDRFEAFRKNSYGTFNPNSQILSFLYVHTGRLDHIILTGAFAQADKVISRSLHRIKRYQYKLDDHRVMVFYFKFAWIYLGAGKASKSITYLNKIINNELKNLREDIQNYARVLQLICHYELGNYDIFEYLINTYSNYFDRKKGLSPFLVHAMNLFKELKSKGESDHKLILQKYQTLFSKAKENPYDHRAMIYLDITSWLESKIRSISLEEVISSKSLQSALESKKGTHTQ